MTNIHWKRLLNDDNFMYYFPNKFYKTVPPKDYFWQVYSMVKPDEYKQAVDKAQERVGEIKKILEILLKNKKSLKCLMSFPIMSLAYSTLISEKC